MTAQRSITASLLGNELTFTSSRSGGPGGQNVNKVNSKVTLRFNIAQSSVLTDEEKTVLLKKLLSRLTNEGELVLTAQEMRSQIQNKEEVIAKFEKIIAKSFEKRKPRKATRPSKGAVQKRIKQKKQHAQKKEWRRKPD